MHLLISLIATSLISLLFYWGLDWHQTSIIMGLLALVLLTINTYALAAAASISLHGLARVVDPLLPTPPDHPNAGACAVLWLICGEPPEAIAAYIRALQKDLATTGQAKQCQIFVLSDTQDPAKRQAEATAFAALRDQIIYRNRSQPNGRKPGNLHDWAREYGAHFDTMLVLDADSHISATRLAQMRYQMAANPRLGLLQSGIRLRPAASRFAQMQRLSARLCGSVFLRGLARVTGNAGNYWGHNALLRVEAFRQAAGLPTLSGKPPFGGPVLSHDFIEAAFLRRAGWEVEVSPEERGSFEDAPTRVADYFRRDRRWAQGNLQHSRFLFSSGLHPMSRMHLLAGIQSYLSAPIWLGLVLLSALGMIQVTTLALLPVFGIALLLLVPKFAGLLLRNNQASPSPWRRRVIRKALLTELMITTLFAPSVMIRRTQFMLAILLGRSAQWVPSGALSQRPDSRLPLGVLEACSAIAILFLISLVNTLTAALVVLPVVLPLLIAPWLFEWFDKPSKKAVQAIVMTKRRDVLLSALALAAAPLLPLPGIRPAQAKISPIEALIQKARQQAEAPYQALSSAADPSGGGLNYDAYRRIQPREGLSRSLVITDRFHADLLPPGWLFKEPVRIHLLGEEIPFSAELFNSPEGTLSGSGFSGLRIRTPLNTEDHWDDVLVLQGASYFRALAANTAYGLSARALSIGTGETAPEEFPVTREIFVFQANDQQLTLGCLIDSPSASAALITTLTPGIKTQMDCRLHLFARQTINNVGIAPLTSMFQHSAMGPAHIDDFRPAVHDSNVLLIENGAGERLWRPLTNPPTPNLSHFVDTNPRGYGLMQTKTRFADYQDAEAAYHQRPSAWVEPQHNWGPGGVMLYEFPTADEFADNIVAFWRPDAPLQRGEHRFDYRLTWQAPGVDLPLPMHPVNSASGRDPQHPERRLFVIDYAVADASFLEQALQLQVVATDEVSISGVTTYQLTERKDRLRTSFILTPKPDAQAAELRVQLLTPSGQSVAPIWLYRWAR